MSFKLTALATAALLAANLAAAQTAAPKAPEPDYTISYNLGAVSDYRFRGIAQTSKKPAIQGGIDAAFKSGVYLGTWASNVNWVKDFNGATKGGMELDLYGGYKGEIAKDAAFDVGVIAYQYPSNNSGAVGTPGAGTVSNANTAEIYGAVTYSIYTAKYSRSTGNFLGFLQSAGSNYIDLSAAFDLGNGMTLTPHAGRQVVTGATAGVSNRIFSYTDYALTFAKDLGNGVTLSAAATGTNGNTLAYTDLNGKTIAKSALVLGAKYSF
jgi:uncharacterized protein (TIGR02001 family)